MNYLAEYHYRVIALRDLGRYVDPDVMPKEPLAIIAERKARISTARP